MEKLLLQPNSWIDNYADALYAFALARINDSTQAEDLVQETFLSAWKARDSFKGEASEKSWLYTILKHKIIDYYRKKGREIITSIAEDSATDHFFDEKEHWSTKDQPGNWGIDAEAKLNNKEFYTVLEKCKKKLQDTQHAVFVMKYMDQLETPEICKALNISSSNYWILIHRAKLQLRACLEKNWINV